MNKMILALILTVGCFVRFHGIVEQGFFMFDEARYLAEAKRLRHDAVWTAHHLAFDRNDVGNLLAGKASGLGYTARTDGGMARPLHTLLLAAFEGREHVMMAVLGVLSVIALGFLASQLAPYDRSLPVFSVLLLALSPVHAFLSRTLLAEVDASFFFVIALIFYSRRSGFLAGLFLGLSLLTQSRMTFVLPFVLIWDFSSRRSLRGTLAIAVGILLPVAVMESFFLLMKLAFLSAGRTDFFQSYFEQFLEAASVERGIPRLNRPFFAIGYLLAAEGLVLVLMFIGGLGVAFREKRTRFVGALALWIIFIATIFDPVALTDYRPGRLLSPVIPLIALIGALAAAKAFEHRIGKGLVLGLIIVLLGTRAESVAEIAGMKADFETVLPQIMERTGARYFFSEEPLHVNHYLHPLGALVKFQEEGETSAIIVFDRSYAQNFGFFRLLPDTPTFTVPRPDHRPSRLQQFESTGTRRDFFLIGDPEVNPIEVFLLPPGYQSKVRVRRLF